MSADGDFFDRTRTAALAAQRGIAAGGGAFETLQAFDAVARVLGRPSGADPGEFLDEYLRTARRARQAVERTFDAG